MNIPKSVISIGNYSFYKLNYTELNIEADSKLESIDEFAFFECPIQKLKLPNSLITIGNHSFSGCLIKTVEFGRNLQIIGHAFSNQWHPKSSQYTIDW